MNIIDVNLNNMNNGIVYTGTLLLGSNLQKASLVFDTGSGNLVVTSENCTTCKSHAYFPSKSNSSHLVERKSIVQKVSCYYIPLKFWNLTSLS